MSNGYILQRKERKTRREAVVNLLFQRSYRYNDLFKASGFGSKSTLNNHLDSLQKEGIVEKAIEHNETVYRLNLDSDTLLSESKNMLFDILLESFDKLFPGLQTVVNGFIIAGFRLRLRQKLRDIEKKPVMSNEEIKYLYPQYFKEAVEKLDEENQIDDSTLDLFTDLFVEALEGRKINPEDSN